jgi:hypothetical protein
MAADDTRDSPPAPPIVLAIFVCGVCGADLLTVEKPAEQAPGTVMIPVPRSMLVTCRRCLQAALDDREARLQMEQLRQWPSDSKLVN